MTKRMLIDASHPEETRVAVLDGNRLEAFDIESANRLPLKGNIYLARVQNVLPGMEAAFIDIGTPKNAVLYRGDVRYDADDVESGGGATKPKNDTKIEQMLKSGQTIMCQVTKNPIGAKGARLTQEVSLPGRFVVLIPNSSTYGISKRLSDDERKRLRSILDKIKPAEHGLIIADEHDAVILREAPHRPMPAGRRRAQILRFGLVAAGRLSFATGLAPVELRQMSPQLFQHAPGMEQRLLVVGAQQRRAVTFAECRPNVWAGEGVPARRAFLGGCSACRTLAARRWMSRSPAPRPCR